MVCIALQRLREKISGAHFSNIARQALSPIKMGLIFIPPAAECEL